MNITNKYKCIPFWSWNEQLNPKQLLEQIKWMDESGIGGFFMHARSGLTTPYLGKEWFNAIKVSKHEAKKRHMEAYAYDENGWPSGFVGGKLLEDQDNCDTYLTIKYGPYDKKALVSYLYKGKELKRTKNGKDCLNVYMHISNSTVDICQKEVVKKFIKLTHEEYAKRDKNHELKGFFTDEPQLYRWDTSYSRALPSYFKRVYKEDILDRLGLLFIELEGYRDFRYKYFKALQTLMLDSYAKQIYTWCDNHNYKLTGHYVEESYLGLQMQCTCGIMPFYEYEHIPGCDWLSRNIRSNSLTGKQLGSVAAQLGKKQVISEMFAGCGWDVTPLELKHIAEYLYVDGINLMCQHLLPYSERGNRKRDYPAHFSSINPWVKKNFKTFNDYFTELGYLLANSKEIVKVAMLHPIRSCYFNFNFNKRNEGWGIKELDEGLDTALNVLDHNHIPFHLLDETILAKYGKIVNKELKCGLCSYKYLLIPRIYTMDKSTEKLLKEFIKVGGKILLLDKKPTYLEGEPHNYSYLKSNIALNELMKAYPFIADNNPNFRLSYHKNKNNKEYLYIVNLGEESYFTINYKGYKTYKCGNEIISSCLHFNKYESKIIYPSNEKIRPIKKLTPLYLKPDFKVKTPIDNYLTLDTVSYSLDNKHYSSSFHHAGVFQELLKKRINQDIYLKYQFNVKHLTDKCLALIENTNTKDVYINKHKVNVSKKDVFLNEYNIRPYLKVGNNEIIIKIHFYQNKQVYYVLFGKNIQESLKNCLVYDTTIEPIYLKGNFGVFGAFKDGQCKNIVLGEKFYLDSLKTNINNLIKDGYPFYHGDIYLSQKVNVTDTNKELIIKDRFQLIDIYVNKKFVTRLMFNYKVDLSKYLKKGENTIDLILTISNRNTYGPFHSLTEEPLMVGPDTFERSAAWKKNKNEWYLDRYSFVKTII
ncbi:MAG: hypothetical protein MJ213_05630 [Bacilli bacterium]|nr:hypothetical protein [Bacilli bacterium]